MFRVLEQMKEREQLRGEQRIQNEWMSWNQRRMQAEREQKDFDEPPPRSNGVNGHQP